MSVYCDRCGEDGNMRWNCEKCNAEFCSDCGTERELQSGYCRNCASIAKSSTYIPSLPPKPDFLSVPEWNAINIMHTFYRNEGPDNPPHRRLTVAALVKLIERVNESEAAMRMAIPVIYSAAEVVDLRLRNGVNGQPEESLVANVDRWLAHEQEVERKQQERESAEYRDERRFNGNAV